MSRQSDLDAPDTVVLIHGLFLTAKSWEKWVERYEGRGYRVIARDWPGMEGDLEELRRDPSGLEELGIAEIVDHYAEIVSELERPPIIMGHSSAERSLRSCWIAATVPPAWPSMRPLSRASRGCPSRSFDRPGRC
jgi:pimeloyl-ACP methyl ester carboxylesterase